MTDYEIEQLEKDARRPNYGSRYYPPWVVLELIEELKKRKQQGELFALLPSETPIVREPDTEYLVIG